MMGYVHVRMRCVGNLPGDTGYHVSHQAWVTDMQYPNGTTIVVCDGRKLRLFRNTGTELHLKLSELPPPDVHGDVEGADRHQHIGGDNADQRRLQDRGRDRSLQEESYAAAVAKWLNHQVIGGKIEQLFVVAPPRTLGELRSHYGDALQAKLLGELGNEHTHDSLQFLEQALKDA
jgi:protein required for attachment to host cells